MAKAPRLIVVVVIDMFPAYFLTHFREQFGPGGFKRLLREGAYFASCFYPYALTETAPAHATLATGTTPNRHGITSNIWYNSRQGRIVQAVEDSTAPMVGGTGDLPGYSPRSLIGTTFSDELRLGTAGQAKVFGVALKDRSAIFSTGHAANGAYWYDRRSGKIVTSRYYREELPPWVATFNEKRSASSYYGKEWGAGGAVFVRLTTDSGAADARFFDQFEDTPYGNDITVEFAQELVAQEKLGDDEATDLLFIGLSANDYVGHRWGPYTPQVADLTRRTDALLARLLTFLDQKVGRGNYWLALSADHGVAPTLAEDESRGVKAKNVDFDALVKTIKEALDARWGADDWLLPRRLYFYFNRETLARHGVSAAEAARVAGEAAMKMDGILGYSGLAQSALDSATAEAFRLSSYPERTRDLEIIKEPYALLNGSRGGTTHGTHYSYDTHVPLMVVGSPFRPGVYWEHVSPTDLAPTLAAALGINPPPLSSGAVLLMALRPPMSSTTPKPAAK
ncbi:MAG: alkaline phosphatase family protein [Candidatus Acidiferrales bacterium]